MKLAYALTILALTIAVNATATTISSLKKEAKLTRLQIDNKLNLSNAVSGKVEISYIAAVTEKNYIELTIYRAMKCTTRVCPRVAYPPYVVKVQLIDQAQNDCGVITYSGKTDRRPVDGDLQKIEVKDNTKNHCPTFVALAPTDVVYTTEVVDRRSGSTIKTRSRLTGEKLVITKP